MCVSRQLHIAYSYVSLDNIAMIALQAQGLCILMGGREALTTAVQRHGIVLAAHGPYTAAGAGDVLGLRVPVVSKNFSTFDGLVAALAERFETKQAAAV